MMATYVIKSWMAQEECDKKGCFVKIHGRQAGFISWLLSLVGIDPTVSLVVMKDKISFESASLAGSSKRYIPLTKVSSMLYGYAKPWQEALAILVFGGCIAGGIGEESGAGAALCVMISLVFAGLYYLLNKKLTVGIVEVGGIVSSIQFKRSVIENQDIDENAAGQVVEIIQRLVDEHSA